MSQTTSKQLLRPRMEGQARCEKGEPCIEVRNLSVGYEEKPALREVSLTIRRGCITAVVGPSGCGKSTFLNCLNRMTDLVPGCRVSGSVRLFGHDITADDTDLVALRRRVGMIFQKPNPFPLSIRKNLTFPLKHHGTRSRRDRDAAVETILRRVGLWEEVKDRLDAPALGLSGGQQQRLCLARALVLEPEILLLDEPCSALDPLSSAVVEELILQLRDSYTVVTVTHNLAQARRLADQTALLWVVQGAGRLVEYGPTRQIFEDPREELTASYVRGTLG